MPRKLGNYGRCVAIVISVYNGHNFLADQLESIVAQSEGGWDLYARDDASSDHSLSVLADYSERHTRFHLISDELGNLGPKGSFVRLLELDTVSSYAYVACSDQDDVWMQDKLSVQLAVMRKLEQEFPGMPLLVHSDMLVVDADMNQIASSFMRYQGIRHEDHDPLKVLLVQNFVTGCTVLVNRKLLEVALPIPDEALMHDWWLALCAAVFGHIGYIDRPLVKYRQHGRNAIGAKRFADFLDQTLGQWKKRWLEGRDHLLQSMKQAWALAERIREHDPNNPHLPLVEAYADLQYDRPMRRLWKIRKLGIHAQSGPRQLLLLSRLLSMPVVS